MRTVEVNKALLREARAGRVETEALALEGGTEFQGTRSSEISMSGRERLSGSVRLTRRLQLSVPLHLEIQEA
jgi:hypothetical protein